jgi:Lrp/AsnC family transcriptional regulator, leucine-responsive regulatory protein
MRKFNQLNARLLHLGPNFTMLDDFDRKILTIIQNDARTPQRDISEAVHLSASAVNRRVEAMKKSGVITCEAAIVDPVKVGRPITIIVEVSVDSDRLEQLDAVRRRFLDCPAVGQLYYVTGDVDFVLILTVSDMAEYEALTRQLFFAEGNVKKFQTLVVMDRAKVSMAVPV